MQPNAFLLLSSSLTTLFAIWMLQPFARRVGLIDLPTARKAHRGEVPVIGGLAIFLGFVITWSLQAPLSGSQLVYTLCALSIVLLGVIDDAKNLPVKPRLVVQTLISLAMCWGTGKLLSDFGNLLGFGNIDLGLIGLLITPIAVIGAINAFNMIDGIDGLAGSLALVSLGAIALMLNANANFLEMALALTLAVCLLPYLAVNLTIRPFKRKIFMGDAGSMLLGFSIVWLLVQGTQNSDPAFRPVAALWFIAIPLMDMTAIMVRRVRRGQSAFQADRDHLHHKFLAAGYSDRQTLTRIICLSVAFAVIGLIGERAQVPEWVMFLSFCGAFAVYMKMVNKIIPARAATKPSLAIAETALDNQTLATTKKAA